MADKIGIYSIEKNCGKTTTAAFLAESFATLSTNVLVIDLDQRNDFSKFLGIQLKVSDLGQVMQVKVGQSAWKYLKVGQDSGLFLNRMEEFDDEFDYILFDFPSFESDSNTEILKILNKIIIPIECEFYGIDQLNLTIEKILEMESLKIDGILLTKYDEKNQIMPKFIKFIKENFSDLVYDTIISRNYYLGLPSFTIENLNKYVPNVGFADYLKLANEIQK
ncbi:ParA family protein [Lacihabitans soyangensis]|uniref:ParA family protein n=1 Tax=Lacihabitans soyangensis TaxID=869394 RepID=A0AAE3KT15_9BACT|nr:ParA family protein [Lacihabitans soyangensis]MCP9763927.1 ParA family protein [Lacihabitans soyangensis]